MRKILLSLGLIVLFSGCGPVDTTAAKETYKNNQQGFSFDYFNDFILEQDIYQDEEIFKDYAQVTLKHKIYENVYFNVFVNHPGTGFEGYTDYQKSEEYLVAGAETEIYYLQSIETRMINALWRHQGDEYIVIFTFTPEIGETEAEEIFKDILESWQFV